jgi:hypothetical protein
VRAVPGADNYLEEQVGGRLTAACGEEEEVTPPAGGEGVGVGEGRSSGQMAAEGVPARSFHPSLFHYICKCIIKTVQVRYRYFLFNELLGPYYCISNSTSMF